MCGVTLGDTKMKADPSEAETRWSYGVYISDSPVRPLC